MSRVIVVKNEDETFTRSTCDCTFCESTHQAAEEWETFVPETKLQKGMKEVVAKIENRALRRSRRLAGLPV